MANSLQRLSASILLSACAFMCGCSTSVAEQSKNVDAKAATYDIPASSLRVRDPFVFADKKSGKYYFHANAGKLSQEQIKRFGVGSNALFAYESKDLKNWRLVGPSFVPPADFWGKGDFWAPDMFFRNGKYYIIATFSAEKPSVKTIRGKVEPLRGSSVLVSDFPDRDFKPLVNAPLTPENYMALDATIFEDNDGTLWLLYAHEWLQVTDGEIVAQKVSKDLTKIEGNPIVLFKASSAPWIKNKRSSYVTDAPVANRLPDGTVYMTWSTFSGKQYYIGVARSPSGKIDGEWIHDKLPLNNDDGGHAMVFKTFCKKTKISYHSPNSKNEKLTIRNFGFKDGKFYISDE